MPIGGSSMALLPGDIDKRVKWAEDYLEAAERDFTYPDYILWTTDEAIFHLDRHINRHNAVIRSVQNPHAFAEELILLFSSMMEHQLIMKPVVEPGWMESWRTDGWAEGDPYHDQHEVLIYLHWTSGFGVT